MIRIATILAGLALAAPAMAQSATVNTMQSKAEAATSPSTASFVEDVAETDLFVMQSGQLAQKRANPATKQVAGQLVQDHRQMMTELKALMAQSGAKTSLPSSPGVQQRLMLTKLRLLKGDQFSENYVNDQENMQTAEMSSFERYGQGGDNPAIKAWAQKKLPMLRQERATAGALDMPH